MQAKRFGVFDWLAGVFPRGVVPTDIDGFVELSGKFLVMEFKAESAVKADRMATGQRRAFQALQSTGLFTIFVIGLNKSFEPSHIRIMSSVEGKASCLKKCDKASLRQLCFRWAQWVEKGCPEKATDETGTDKARAS